MILHVLPVTTSDDIVLLVKSPEHKTVRESFLETGGQLTDRDRFFSALKWFQSRYSDIVVHIDQSAIQ